MRARQSRRASLDHVAGGIVVLEEDFRGGNAEQGNHRLFQLAVGPIRVLVIGIGRDARHAGGGLSERTVRVVAGGDLVVGTADARNDSDAVQSSSVSRLR